ncbi:hypothetical protein V8C43DRAFT_50815 [Trichoderma afarasin]
MEVISSLETVPFSRHHTKEFISISTTTVRYIPSDTRYMFTLWKTKSKTTCKTKSKTTSKTIWKMCGGGHSHSHPPRGRSRQSHSHHSHSHSHSHSHGRRGGGCGGHSHGHDHDDHPSNGRYEPELVQIAVPEPEAKPYVCYCTGPIPPMPAPNCYPMICCYKDAPPNCNWPVMPPNCLPPPCLPAPCLPTVSCVPSLPPGSFSYVCPPPPASDEFRLEVIDTSDGRNRARNGEKYTITIDSKATIDDVFYMVDYHNEKDVQVRWKNDILEELTQEIRVGELKRNAKCLVVMDFCCGH